MKRLFAVLFTLCVVFLTASPVWAFGFGDIKSWFQGETIPLLLTGGIFLLALIFGVLFAKVVQTLKEAGEAMIVLADALHDRKITKDEYERIKAEVRQVVNIWRETPEEYLPDAPAEPKPYEG
jgi:hypothetical protein